MDSAVSHLTTDNMSDIEVHLHERFLEYKNDFLSVSGFASFYDIDLDIADEIISLGRRVTVYYEDEQEGD